MYGPCLNSDAKLKKKVRYTYNKENTGKSVNLETIVKFGGIMTLCLFLLLFSYLRVLTEKCGIVYRKNTVMSEICF